MTTQKENFVSENSTKKKPSCACVYDVDGTLTNLSYGSNKEIAIDARASAESCINAGCAIGLVTNNKLCTDKDPDNCKITEYAFGFNIKDPKQVSEASRKLKKKIITGENWILNNIDKGNAMKSFSQKLSNKGCGILIDDNVLQSCGKCNTFDKNSYCPAPWGAETEEPEMNQVKKSYKCKFFSKHSKDSGDDYLWIPAREIDKNKKDLKNSMSQMGGTGFLWNDGSQTSIAEGITKEYWNTSLTSGNVKEFSKKCQINIKPVYNPTLKTKLSEIKRCEYKKNPPKCKTYRDCENYMRSNCKNKIMTDYTYQCLDKKNKKNKYCKIVPK